MSITNRKNKEDYPAGCNWWCRRWSDVKDIANGIKNGGVIGGLLTAAELYTDIFDKGEFDAFAGSYQFTSSEETILDNWYFSHYEKFVQNITALVENKFVGMPLSIQKITYANSILGQLSAIKYANTLDKTLGLSATAKTIRLKLVNDFINTIEVAVKQEMAKFPTYEIVKTDVNVSAISGMTATVLLKNCEQYSIKSTNGSTTGNNNQTGGELVLEPIENNPSTPNETTPTNPKKSSLTLGKSVLVGLGIWAGYEILK